MSAEQRTEKQKARDAAARRLYPQSALKRSAFRNGFDSAPIDEPPYSLDAPAMREAWNLGKLEGLRHV